jgi:hypothetical protein
MSKKLEEKQRRRLAAERRKAEERKAHRRRNLLTIGIALAVFAGVVLLIVNERSKEGVDTSPIGVSASRAGCEPIKSITGATREHVPEGTQIDYKETPPMGGNHWPTPVDATFYTSELEDEPLVHNEEHGQIVIWYQPDLPSDVKDEIDTYVTRENDATLQSGARVGPLVAVPYSKIQGNFQFVMTTWEHSQSCALFSSEAVDDFRVKYQGRGPELVVPTYTKP